MKTTPMRRRAAPLFAALAIGLLVFWMMSTPESRPAAKPAVPALTSGSNPPPSAQPPETALLAEARQLRVDPNAMGNTSCTTNLHPSGVLRFVGMEPGWSLGKINQDAGLVEGVRK